MWSSYVKTQNAKANQWASARHIKHLIFTEGGHRGVPTVRGCNSKSDAVSLQFACAHACMYVCMYTRRRRRRRRRSAIARRAIVNRPGISARMIWILIKEAISCRWSWCARVFREAACTQSIKGKPMDNSIDADYRLTFFLPRSRRCSAILDTVAATR